MIRPIDYTKSRQRRWQIRQQAKKRCIICGKRQSRLSHYYCLEHKMYVRVYTRVYMRRYSKKKEVA